MTGTFVCVWLILLGPVAGSFVTAVADRHCAGLDISRGRSHCFSCGARLTVRDLVPLLSYAILRGKCRTCKSPIGLHVWLGEWAGLAIGSLAVAWGDSSLDRILAAFFLWLLLGLFQADRLCMRLPDLLTLPLFALGLALGATMHGVVLALAAGAAGATALWLVGKVYHLRHGETGIGFGDVKLMAGLSAAVGPLAVPWVTLVAAMTALGMAAVARMRGQTITRWTRVPFGCHLALAGALILLLTPR